MKGMSRTVLIAILILAASSSAIGQAAQGSSKTFHWLNSSEDATQFERITTAFTDELKPDDPEKVKPVVAQEYKWISRVGVFDESRHLKCNRRVQRRAI
jgi:ABC-type glycerol-3-phosphate transport system substrate-binding protein